MPAGICRVRCLGFRYILRVDGDDTSAAPMSGHHHSQRLILAHAEFRLQTHDDELAGREVIIDQDDFMQTRPFDLYLILDLGLGGGANHVRTAFVGHGSCEIIGVKGQPEAAYGGCATSIRSQRPYPLGSNLAYDNVVYHTED